MKKIVSVLLFAALILCACAGAESVPDISDSLFSAAKEALSLLSYGEYESICDVLPFADVAPSAEEWANFAGNFSTLDSGTVQREISVAYWQNSSWSLAVPVSGPNKDSVETLILRSDDGQTFSGYKYATWGEARSGYESSDYVVWNEEYVAGTPVVIAD